MSKSFQLPTPRMAILLVLVLLSCTMLKKIQRESMPADRFKKLSNKQLELKMKSSPFLKMHMKNGNVYILQNWAMDSTRGKITGQGVLLNARREKLFQGNVQVGVDSVVLFETNVLKQSGSATALTVFTGITVAITAYCLTNPKACFGSCPTFYISDGDSLQPDAEGFSASIAPSLEASDSDALFHAASQGDEFAIEMRNEALETHVVRYVNLLAVPRSSGQRVFADAKGNFWESSSLIAPSAATAPEGSCLNLLSHADRMERYSEADSSYLGAKEYIEIEFDDLTEGKYGLVIGARQSLLSTYLLYQTFAYMGHDVGYWLAQVERGRLGKKANDVLNILGGIDVMMKNKFGIWKVVDKVNEYGPLAIDFHLLKLGHLSKRKVKIRLRMTKGNWRIDYVALAKLSKPVQPVRLKPYQVLKEDVIDQRALTLLSDSLNQLVTLPGDRYTLKYQLPKNAPNYELFLKSRGYYLEWIRKEWIEEENPHFLSELWFNPRSLLKRLAPQFKKVEKEIEDCFWNSRYEKSN